MRRDRPGAGPRRRRRPGRGPAPVPRGGLRQRVGHPFPAGDEGDGRPPLLHRRDVPVGGRERRRTRRAHAGGPPRSGRRRRAFPAGVLDGEDR
ncbi:hypothetical protein E6R18_01155 [Streptomyces sp. A1277]|nr:hypothetical protein E6R18_01155 [Streptomyces sp. A1277]